MPINYKKVNREERPIMHIDMDGTIFDYKTPFIQSWIDEPERKYPQSKIGFFENLKPFEGAVEVIEELKKKYDVWICTRCSPKNIHSYSEKRISIEKHLGFEMCNKLILTPNKSLIIGDYLIDDNIHEGFIGTSILFGSEEFPDWNAIRGRFL